MNTLGVVIPMYNEEAWIAACLDALFDSAKRAGQSIDVVVVDDGSSDGSPAIVQDYATRHPNLRIVRQTNQGRLRARVNGLSNLTTERALLLDSRAILHPEALTRLRALLSSTPSIRAVNGDVELRPNGTPFPLFWQGLTRVGWRAYFANRRRCSYGIEDFDRYPKGTGTFVADRLDLLAASGTMTSLYDDATLLSDDTSMLREIAKRHRIHIDPGFSADHIGRDNLRAWVRMSRYRGTTFVDSYFGRQGPVRRTAISAGIVGIILLPFLLRRPRRLFFAVSGGSVALGASVLASGGTRKEAASVTGLAIPFGLVFGSGVFRGLWLATRAAARRAR